MLIPIKNICKELDQTPGNDSQFNFCVKLVLKSFALTHPHAMYDTGNRQLVFPTPRKAAEYQTRFLP